MQRRRPRRRGRSETVAGKLPAPVHTGEGRTQLLVDLVDSWVERHAAGALVFPVAADFPEMAEGKIPAARQIRGPPRRDRMHVPLRMSRTFARHGRPFGEAPV